LARFTPKRVHFGARPEADDDDGRDLPPAKLVKVKARRAAGIKEASDTLAVLPAPGEALHAVCTARLDMTDVLNVLFGKLGRCDELAVATLGMNLRNARALVEWLDCGAVGSLVLLASRFFWSHNKPLWEQLHADLTGRNQLAAFAPSHCKVMTLAFADGRRYVIEGSANLCSNGSSREQFMLLNDADGALYSWHRHWIREMVKKYAPATD
jgi:hypothetical protein